MMDMGNFIVVGENIHCTRIVKSGGKRTTKLPDGGEGVTFKYKGEDRVLPVPSNWAKLSSAYNEGKIRHITLAIYHTYENSSSENRKTGEDYLCWATERQVEKGAKFLDINVDEYSYDPVVRNEVMKWLVTYLGGRYETPLSIDSSNVDTLVAGLECCRKDVDPMVNSVSLEREDAVEVVMQYKAHAIVSAAGKKGLPSTADERLTNFKAIIEILDKVGMERSKMHLDSLVLPISVDPLNGKNFLESTAKAKETFPGVNLTGGLSNVSFGMPNRKLLNLVFTWLFVEAGGNGGIIDPVQMSPVNVAALDQEAETFKLAQAVLEGADMYGVNYIGAYRAGKLG
jgi:5-methyltetrahydrofolate--homocysteine methyltransferase